MDYHKVKNALQNFSIDPSITAMAQKEIAPLRNNSFDESIVANAKKAGVLLCVHPVNNQAFFTLIERQTYSGAHSNQIAFPGGKVESSDQNIVETATREADEEVNIKSNHLQIIGELSSIYVPPSNFYVTPILALSSIQPDYAAQESEVKNIIEMPILELLKEDVVQETKIEIKKGIHFNTPYLHLQNKIVWGATAMILNEFRRWLLFQQQR